MKRFLVFAGENYYPSKGMRDFVGDFSDFAEAEKKASEKKQADDLPEYKWAIVYDTEERKEVYSV